MRRLYKCSMKASQKIVHVQLEGDRTLHPPTLYPAAVGVMLEGVKYVFLAERTQHPPNSLIAETGVDI